MVWKSFFRLYIVFIWVYIERVFWGKDVYNVVILNYIIRLNVKVILDFF